LAKEAKYLILLSKNVPKINTISEYIIANYGITPIITNDMEYAFSGADFIINSRDKELVGAKGVWYLNNGVRTISSSKIAVNDVSYKVPWKLEEDNMSAELLGSILCQMEEKDIEKALRYNGIFLDKIKFNEDTWKFN
jgi:hypothetical protein